MGFSVEEDDAVRITVVIPEICMRIRRNIARRSGYFLRTYGCCRTWKRQKSVLEKDGTIHSAGDTVLGADDISGILEILYGVQLVLDSGKPHKKLKSCLQLVRNYMSKVRMFLTIRK